MSPLSLLLCSGLTVSVEQPLRLSRGQTVLVCRLLLTCYICLDVLTISNSCLFPPPPTSYHRHPPKCSNLYPLPLPLPPLAQNTPTTPACWWWRQMGRWGSLTYTIYKYHLYSVHTLYKLIQTPNVCGLLSDPDCSSSMISITMRAVMRNNII